MTESEGFTPDTDDSAMQYDYSTLNRRYEVDVEKNEIIEWNKHESNARYQSLEKIAERLNFKQMQIETCREDYGRIYEGFEQVTDDLLELKEEYCILQKENEQLKQEIKELQEKSSNWKIAASEEMMKQSELMKENVRLKKELNHDKEVEWLRNNTVWEQMPTTKKTFTKTTVRDKKMTEKRFSSNSYEEEGRVITDYRNELTQNEVVDLLNRLNDENERLKSLLNEISDKNDRILLNDGRIIQLRKVFKGEWK